MNLKRLKVKIIEKVHDKSFDHGEYPIEIVQDIVGSTIDALDLVPVEGLDVALAEFSYPHGEKIHVMGQAISMDSFWKMVEAARRYNKLFEGKASEE